MGVVQIFNMLCLLLLYVYSQERHLRQVVMLVQWLQTFTGH